MQPSHFHDRRIFHGNVLCDPEAGGKRRRLHCPGLLEVLQTEFQAGNDHLADHAVLRHRACAGPADLKGFHRNLCDRPARRHHRDDDYLRANPALRVPDPGALLQLRKGHVQKCLHYGSGQSPADVCHAGDLCSRRARDISEYVHIMVRHPDLDDGRLRTCGICKFVLLQKDFCKIYAGRSDRG